MEADKEYHITTFTLQLGKERVFNLARWVIAICYIGMSLSGVVLVDSVNPIFLGV